MILFPILLLLTFTRSVFSNFTLTDHGHGIATGFCKLTATGSKQFSSTTPYFKMGEDGEPFDVSDAGGRMGGASAVTRLTVCVGFVRSWVPSLACVRLASGPYRVGGASEECR